MKKNTNRFPRIRGRIFENTEVDAIDTNVDEHKADGKFLINADACNCTVSDIKDILEADGLSVSTSGKWVTVRTTSETDANEAAKSIRKVCKGKYATFVIDDAKSHNKAAHSEFIKTNESKIEENTMNTNRRRTNNRSKLFNIQKEISESLITFYKNSNRNINESSTSTLANIKNPRLINEFVRTYKKLNNDSMVNEALDSLKRWSRTNRRNRLNENMNPLLEEVLFSIYDDFVIFAKGRGIKLPENPRSVDEAIANMSKYKKEYFNYINTATYKFDSEDPDYGEYYHTVTNMILDGDATMQDYYEGTPYPVQRRMDPLLEEIVFAVYDDFVVYVSENQPNISLPTIARDSKTALRYMQEYADIFAQFIQTPRWKFDSEDPDYAEYYKQIEENILGSEASRMYESKLEKIKNFRSNRANKIKEIQESVNEAKNERINTINKVEGYFIGTGKIRGLANKSTLLSATINEGIRPLIETEKDVKQKQLLESFEKWALLNGKQHINESELIGLHESSDVDANTRKKLFESAIDDMINNKSVKNRRSKNIDRIKKYL